MRYQRTTAGWVCIGAAVLLVEFGLVLLGLAITPSPTNSPLQARGNFEAAAVCGGAAVLLAAVGFASKRLEF